MTDPSSMMLTEGERNENGDIIWEFELQKRNGEAKTVEVNATHLFQPGLRKSGDIELLVTEAELASDGEHGGNPAKPANADVAERAIRRIESEDLTPAWRVVEGPDFP